MSDCSLTNEMVSIPSRKDHLSKFNERRPAGYPSDKEIPVVLVLKRKAIRVYPDNQKVVLYYSQALDKYVSIPFGPKSDVLGSPLNESRKPKKEKDDKHIITKALYKFPGIAAHYGKAKEEQPERRALRKMAVKLTRQQKDALSPKERDVIYKTSKDIVKSSNLPLSQELGMRTGLWAQKKWGDIKASRRAKKARQAQAAQPPASSGLSTPSPAGAATMPPKMGKTPVSSRPSIAESYKHRVNDIRQQKLDEEGEWKSLVPGYDAYQSYKKGDYGSALGNLALDAATLTGVGALAKGAKVASVAYKARKAAAAAKAATMGSKTKQVQKWLKNRKANKQLRKMGDDVANAAKGGAKRLTPRQRLRLANRKYGGKLASGAGAAAGAALKGLKAVGDVADAAADAGKKYGGGSNHQFTLQPKVGDPRSQQIVRGGSETDQQKRSWGIKENVSTSNLSKIKYIVENNINSYDMTFEGSDNSISINNRVAKKVLQVYETLNTTNKNKFSKMLNENATTFKQAINFVIRH